MPLCARLPLLVAADKILHLDDAIATATGRALELARVQNRALRAVGVLMPEQVAANMCSSFMAISTRARSNGYGAGSKFSGWRWQLAGGVRSATSYHLRVKLSCETFLFNGISKVNDARAAGAFQPRLCRRLWRHFPASRRTGSRRLNATAPTSGVDSETLASQYARYHFSFPA
jgi:hypothetical protein